MQRPLSHQRSPYSRKEWLKSKRDGFQPTFHRPGTVSQAICSAPADIFQGLLASQRQKEALTQISNPFTDPSPRKQSQTSPALPKALVHQAGCHSPRAAEEVGAQSWRTSSRIQVTSISQGEAPGHKSFSPREVHKWSSYKKDPRDLCFGGGWCLARGGDDYGLVAGAGG